MIENPVTPLASYWRRPDFFLDPCDYGAWLDPPGDHYAKKRSVWTGNGFRDRRSAALKPCSPSEQFTICRAVPTVATFEALRREVSRRQSLPPTLPFESRKNPPDFGNSLQNEPFCR